MSSLLNMSKGDFAEQFVIPHVGMKGFRASEFYRNLVYTYIDRVGE